MTSRMWHCISFTVGGFIVTATPVAFIFRLVAFLVLLCRTFLSPFPFLVLVVGAGCVVVVGAFVVVVVIIRGCR
jgi:hypothetical protein